MKMVNEAVTVQQRLLADFSGEEQKKVKELFTKRYNEGYGYLDAYDMAVQDFNAEKTTAFQKEGIKLGEARLGEDVAKARVEAMRGISPLTHPELRATTLGDISQQETRGMQDIGRSTESMQLAEAIRQASESVMGAGAKVTQMQEEENALKTLFTGGISDIINLFQGEKLQKTQEDLNKKAEENRNTLLRSLSTEYVSGSPYLSNVTSSKEYKPKEFGLEEYNKLNQPSDWYKMGRY